MIKSNDTLKIPGQIRDRKRQKNNENSGIRVRIIQIYIKLIHQNV